MLHGPWGVRRFLAADDARPWVASRGQVTAVGASAPSARSTSRLRLRMLVYTYVWLSSTFNMRHPQHIDIQQPWHCGANRTTVARRWNDRTISEVDFPARTAPRRKFTHASSKLSSAGRVPAVRSSFYLPRSASAGFRCALLAPPLSAGKLELERTDGRAELSSSSHLGLGLGLPFDLVAPFLVRRSCRGVGFLLPSCASASRRYMDRRCCFAHGG